MNHRPEPNTGHPRQEGNAGVRELRALRRRLTLAPDNTKLRLHVAELLARNGRRAEALEELRVLVHLAPNHLVARKLREELSRNEPEPPAPPLGSEALH